MKSKDGEAQGGESFDPEELPEEPEHRDGPPRPAPAPGVPVSDEEFERMKEAANRAPTSGAGHAQEDRHDKEKGDD